jgi:uncharacterized protein (TIGR03663 family)
MAEALEKHRSTSGTLSGDVRQVEPDTQDPPFAWLTWEIALYGLILTLALALRLGWLETRIMDVSEAHQAWQAWRLATGKTPTGSYSPLLLSGQALVFALFGASDAAARLLPVLAGSALVALPYLLRRQLGRIGALAAALALAISPSLVYSARYGDGAAWLLTATLGLVALWLAYRRERRGAHPYAIAALAAIALLADPRVVGVLIALALAWAVERFLLARDPLGLDRAAVSGEQPVAWGKIGLCFASVLVVAATAFSLNPGGLGAWADFPAAWVRHLMPVVNGQPWYYPMLALALYEPFSLLFGLIGAVSLFAQPAKGQEPGGLSILVWMAAGFALLAFLSGGRDVGDVALVCAPLAILAGYGIERLVESWGEESSWARDSVLALIALLVLAYVGIQASFYARAVYLNREQSQQFLWFWMLALALLVFLGGFSLAWLGGRVTWRATGTVLAVVLLSSSFSAAIGLNYRRANDPRELHILLASDEGTRDLLGVMTDFSYHGWGAPRAIPVVVEEGLGPLWPWYLRDWEDVTFVSELTSDTTAPMVLSAEEQASSAQSGWNPSERYLGQDFVTRTWWQPSELYPSDPLSWWLYRKSLSRPIPVQRIVLWIQAQETEE